MFTPGLRRGSTRVARRVCRQAGWARGGRGGENGSVGEGELEVEIGGVVEYGKCVGEADGGGDGGDVVGEVGARRSAARAVDRGIVDAGEADRLRRVTEEAGEGVRARA